MIRKYWGHRPTRKEKRERQQRRQREMEQRGEMRRRRASAYQGAVRGKKVRTDEERADCLLKGLQSDIENFYSQVISRAGLGQEKSYGWQDGSILGSGFFYDTAIQRPGAGSHGDEIDEFLKKTGMGPRNFLSHGKLKGMACRLKTLGKYLDSSSLMPGYTDLMRNLKRTGIYKELVKLDKSLLDLPATIS